LKRIVHITSTIRLRLRGTKRLNLLLCKC